MNDVGPILHLRDRQLAARQANTARHKAGRSGPASIYVIENPATGLTKVGQSTTLDIRFDGLQRKERTILRQHYAIPVMAPFARLVESDAHRRLEQWRADRKEDWFKIPPLVATYAVETALDFVPQVHLTGGQLRKARQLLGWSARVLAENSGVTVGVLCDAERRSGPIRGHICHSLRLRQTFDAEGIDFIENGSMQRI